MSDSELNDDWTALVAKEASVLRSGQAWADIFDDDDDDDDDDDEDTGISNEANEQAEGSTTVVYTEHNKMPVDYLDDIDLTIPLPRPQTSVSTPTHLNSNNEFYHPSEDSDNWRVRETKPGAESDNWRKRDPHGVKPISFASFSNKDRFDDNHQQEERKEYRKPEKRRIDPEDAAALEKWNTFHLVVAQEELEKEKEKERLKNLYLESLKNGSAQLTELVKGDTNQQICINSTESQVIIDQSSNIDQSNQESVSNINSLENEEKEPKQSQELLPHDAEKEALKESQPIADSSNSVKPGSLDKEEESSNINEETKEETRKGDGEDLIHTEKPNESEELKGEGSPTDDGVKIEDNVTEENIQITAKSIDHEKEKGNNDDDSKNEEPTGHVLSTQPETHDDLIAKAKSDFEEKQEPLEEGTLTLPKQDEFNVETATGNGSMSNKCDPNNEKDQLVSAEEKSEFACDEKETVLASSIPAEKIKETNQSPKNEEADETNSVHADHKDVPSEEQVENDKINSLSQLQEAELEKNTPNDSEKPSEQPMQAPVTQSNGSNEPETSNTVELVQEQPHSQQGEHPVYDGKSKDRMEEDTANEPNEEINNVKIPSDNQLEEATEHPLPESSSSEKILEKGDSLQEIKEEYADFEKQELKDTKESESSEKEGEGQNEQHENLQLECNGFDNPQFGSSEPTCDNVRNDTALHQSDNSARDEDLNTTTLSSTNSDGQAPIKESDQANTIGWGETPVKEETGWGGAIEWNQGPAKDFKKDGSEGSTKHGEGKSWSNQDDSQTASDKHTNASWNQGIVQDNKLDGSNERSQVPVQQWGESNWNQNQNSNNAKSESDQNWKLGPKIQSPKVEAKKPSPGSWRDQIALAPKDDNVGGWKKFATDQAAHNVIKETRIESPKPKKAFLPKSVHNSPKLEKSWVGDSTSWSKKSDVTQATSTSSIQSDTPQADSTLLSTNQQSWSKSPIVSNSNTSWSNTSTSVLEPSDMSQKEPSSTSSPSPSASNPWAEFSALEKERSARSQTQSKQSQSQAPSQVQPQPQLQHEATQTTPLQTSTEPPVISISLSDFDSVQLEHKKVKRPNAPVEINMTWNGGDIIIDSPAENSTIMHVPLVVSLDGEPQELSVTPKLEHATLAANPTHSNHSTGWNTAHRSRPEPTTEHHIDIQNIPMDGSQWKLASHFLDK